MNRKNLAKILRYLNRHLKLDEVNIRLNPTICGIEQDFYPNFCVFHNRFDEDVRNMLMVVIYHETANKNVELMKSWSKKYFLNFENLYFVLFFDKSLRPFLFVKQENDNETNIIMVEGKYIRAFN